MNKNNRLGCLTGSGVLAAFITLFVLVGVAFASGSQMFSSGALNAQPGESMGGVDSHAQIQDCQSCHTAPWERATMADRCLECHTNIADQMRDVAQLHGSIVQKSPSVACRDCHQEHRGASASLTDLGENSFPHESLGFSLNEHQRKDGGAPIVCEDCHGEGITTFASDSCQTCHNDMDIAFTQAHVLSFGADCLACHDGVDRFDDFNHNAYPFKLQGGHGGDIPCTKCHLDARSITDLQSAPQDCYSCHVQDDVHNGENGSDCETCHNVSSWDDADFDHSRTNFPLAGGHSNVECDQCHTNGTYKGLSTACVSCHQDPAFHTGAFGTQCESCHDIQGWSPAEFNFSHPEPRVDEGGSGIRHGGASCRECHPSSVFEASCTSCHEGNNFEGGEGGDD